MNNRTIVRAAAATAATGLFALAPISPAAAEEWIEMYTSGARANFDAWDPVKGEAIRIKDKAKDGLGVRAYLHWSSTKSASVTEVGGLGHTAKKTLSIREGTKVDLQICYVNKAGVDVKCSGSKRGEA